MKRVLGVLFITIVSMTMLAASGIRSRNANRHFLGLWEGVDVNDGSKRSISITDRDRDGIFEVAARDTYWTLCQGDRGLEAAMGSIRYDGVLETEGLVTCWDESGGIETQVKVTQEYQYSRRANTLYATAVGTGLIPITLHRVSE